MFLCCRMGAKLSASAIAEHSPRFQVLLFLRMVFDFLTPFFLHCVNFLNTFVFLSLLFRIIPKFIFSAARASRKRMYMLNYSDFLGRNLKHQCTKGISHLFGGKIAAKFILFPSQILAPPIVLHSWQIGTLYGKKPIKQRDIAHFSTKKRQKIWQEIIFLLPLRRSFRFLPKKSEYFDIYLPYNRTARTISLPMVEALEGGACIIIYIRWVERTKPKAMCDYAMW